VCVLIWCYPLDVSHVSTPAVLQLICWSILPQPSNLILSLDKRQATLRLADLSSAVDTEGLLNGIYGTQGPRQDEETLEYMPPEVGLPACMIKE